jgi:hypothetical protein
MRIITVAKITERNASAADVLVELFAIYSQKLLYNSFLVTLR